MTQRRHPLIDWLATLISAAIVAVAVFATVKFILIPSAIGWGTLFGVVR
jgi:hypothetical protein